MESPIRHQFSRNLLKTMILDKVANLQQYASLHPDFEKVFKILLSTDFKKQPKGKMKFEGESFFINVDEVSLRPAKDAKLEVHNDYIDIQIPITISEKIGFKHRTDCTDLAESRPENDIYFYNDQPDSYIQLDPESFVIFFPQDAHAPIIGEGNTKKIVAKIKIK